MRRNPNIYVRLRGFLYVTDVAADRSSRFSNVTNTPLCDSLRSLISLHKIAGGRGGEGGR